MKKKLLTPIAVSIMLLNACKKDDKQEDVQQQQQQPQQEESVPKIVISKPDGTHYHVGDTAFVQVVVSDDHEMHEAKCWFITKPQNDTLWQLRRHAHSKTITFNSYYVIEELPDEQEVDFIVVGENEAGKTVTAKHSFEVHDH